MPKSRNYPGMLAAAVFVLPYVWNAIGVADYYRHASERERRADDGLFLIFLCLDSHVFDWVPGPWSILLPADAEWWHHEVKK